METTEHIIETYYRLAKKCFTIPDIKVLEGNNRQIDILAYRPKGSKYYHIESNVTHCRNWCKPLDTIQNEIEYKFFGIPKNKRPNNPNTDSAKGKTYIDQIKKTYELYGANFDKVIRVWCSWYYKEENEELENFKNRLSEIHNLPRDNFKLLSFRDEVLPELMTVIGTSNYSDEILRTLSLLSQYEIQKK